MRSVLVAITTYLGALFLPRHRLALECAALRQQLVVFKRKQPRPKLELADRLFWRFLRHIDSGWADLLIVVKPETVVSWHRAGFRLLWRWRSRGSAGRPALSAEVRLLIGRMKRENLRWGAPRIHGELLQLGFEVSEASVSRYLRRLKPQGKPDKAKQWLTFLHNHREVIAAFDFFTVPTLSFRTLYCFFVIEHGRRRILAFNCTAHPTADWIVQQLRQAFPDPCPYRYVVFDRDAKFGKDVVQFLRSTGLRLLRSSIQCPWQNGTTERWVQSARRDVMDHLIPINEQHLRRLAREYVAYYHEDRTHIGLKKSTPNNRPVETRSDDACQVQSDPRLGGLHHRYTWKRAA